MSRLFPAWLAVLLVFVVPAAMATGSTYYVSDELVIGVYAKSSLAGKPLETLRSGAPVEIISREVNAARVRVPNGKKGWIDNDYLVADKPDSIRLLSLQDENSRLKAEKESLQAELSLSARQLSRARSRLSPEDQAEDYVDPQTLRLMKENVDLKNRISAAGDALGVVDLPPAIDNTGQNMPLLWVVISAAVALLLGFIVGLLWLDRSIRRRHGGFRI